MQRFSKRTKPSKRLGQIRQLKKSYLNVGLTNKSKIFNYELQEALELGNMLRVAEVIVYSALQRKESRGAHFRSDYPERNDKEWLKHSFVNETPTGLEVTYKPVVISKFAPQKTELLTCISPESLPLQPPNRHGTTLRHLQRRSGTQRTPTGLPKQNQVDKRQHTVFSHVLRSWHLRQRRLNHQRPSVLSMPKTR